MNNNIQCSIESSTTKIKLNSAVDGVFLVPELEGLAGLPEIRTTSGVNAGYDGGWTSAQNYDARLISIRGVIANPDISKVEDKRRAIASLLGQGRKEQLTLRFTTQAGNAYAISVRTISCEMALQRVLTTQEFLIQLRADDPLIYDDGTTGGIAAILQPQRALGGFEINFGLPLAIGGGAEDTVVDNGNETVYPVIKLYGALHSPTVVNRTTNQQMQILADLQYSIDWHTYRSTTGDYILVNDGLNGAPMTLSQLTGNAEQTTYSGKNLLYATELPKTQSNVTATYQDGIFGLSGTSSIATNLYVLPYAQSIVHLEAGESITMLIERVSGTSKVYFTGYFEPDDASAIEYDWGLILESGASTVKRVRTASKAGNLTHVQMFINANTTYNSTAKILVQKGNIANPTWEPYVGGTASPNPDYPQPISTVTGEQTVKITGKNLFDKDNANILIAYIDASHTSITYNSNNRIIWIPCQPNTTYTLQKLAVGTSWYARQIAYTTQEPAVGVQTYSMADMAGNDTSKTYTTGADAKYLVVRIWVSGQDAETFDAMLGSIQLELGSTATAYEPYQGQEFEVNLGKNLFDKDNAPIAHLLIGTTSLTATSSGGATYIPVVGGQTYTFSRKNTTDQVSDSAYCFTSELPAGEVPTIGRTVFGNNLTFTATAPENAKYLVIYFAWAKSDTAIRTIFETYQIELGSQPTSYSAYFTPIELAKIGNYQDRIYKTDGKWYIEKQVGKVVLNGSETWSISGSVYYTSALASTIAPIPANEHYLGLSDYFEVVGFDYQSATNLFFHPNKNLQVKNTNWATLNDWKSWLGTHNTTVYYALATPTTTEITDETLLLQLNFLASLYKGENNISLVGTGAQGEMTIRYATDYTVNQDVITIDSQARTITLNGQDVYHLKTSESEFLVLAPGENKLYLTSEVSDDSGYAEVKFKQGYLSI